MLKVEFEISESDMATLLSIINDYEEQKKREAEEYKSAQRPDGTWPRKTDLYNHLWCKGHAEYIEALRLRIQAGSKPR